MQNAEVTKKWNSCYMNIKLLNILLQNQYLTKNNVLICLIQ